MCWTVPPSNVSFDHVNLWNWYGWHSLQTNEWTTKWVKNSCVLDRQVKSILCGCCDYNMRSNQKRESLRWKAIGKISIWKLKVVVFGVIVIMEVRNRADHIKKNSVFIFIVFQISWFQSKIRQYIVQWKKKKPVFFYVHFVWSFWIPQSIKAISTPYHDFLFCLTIYLENKMKIDYDFLNWIIFRLKYFMHTIQNQPVNWIYQDRQR